MDIFILFFFQYVINIIFYSMKSVTFKHQTQHEILGNFQLFRNHPFCSVNGVKSYPIFISYLEKYTILWDFSHRIKFSNNV